MPNETRTVVLFGVSLGAAVALATAQIRQDIEAVILESPYTTYRQAVLAHAKIQNLPGRLLWPAAIRLAKWISSARFEEVQPIDLILKVSCPVMVINAADDPFADPADSAALGHAVQRRGDPTSVYWKVNGAKHVLSMAVDPDEYRQRIAAFISQLEPRRQTSTESSR